VQIVWSSRHGSRKIEHLGSAHDEAGVGLGEHSAAEPLSITSSKSSLLWDALCAAYARVGFDQATGGEEVFRQLVLVMAFTENPQPHSVATFTWPPAGTSTCPLTRGSRG